jgi:hypothetical protein
MRSLRLLIGSGAVAAISLLTVPTVALASTHAVTNDNFSGVETGIPTPCGPSGSGDSSSPFAGAAWGGLNGTFSAAICHPAVAVYPGKTTAIISGSFVLSSLSGATLSGSFAPNPSAITAEAPSHYDFFFCKQRFLVRDSLTPGGSVAAVLTHYSTVYSSSGCAGTVVFATVSGAVSISS